MWGHFRSGAGVLVLTPEPHQRGQKTGSGSDSRGLMEASLTIHPAACWVNDHIREALWVLAGCGGQARAAAGACLRLVEEMQGLQGERCDGEGGGCECFRSIGLEDCRLLTAPPEAHQWHARCSTWWLEEGRRRGRFSGALPLPLPFQPRNPPLLQSSGGCIREGWLQA